VITELNRNLSRLTSYGNKSLLVVEAWDSGSDHFYKRDIGRPWTDRDL
jgi:hypothetical protein